MRFGKMVRFAAVGLAVALVTAACGDGDGDDVTTEAAGDFSALVEEASEARIRVTYTNDDGDEITFSQDPPKQAILTAEARVITTADVTIVCTGEETDAPQCFEIEGTGEESGGLVSGLLGGFAAPFFAFTSLADERLADVETSEREIAGRTAICAEVQATGVLPGVDLEGEATYCIDADTGALLLSEATTADGETQRFEATDVGDPRPEDFEPPVEPVSPGSIPGLEDLPDGGDGDGTPDGGFPY